MNKLFRKQPKAKIKPYIQPIKPSTFGYCVICIENPASICAVPCGHIAVCDKCSTKLKKKCVICNDKYTQIIKVYNSSINVDTEEEKSRKKLIDEIIELRKNVKQETKTLTSLAKNTKNLAKNNSQIIKKSEQLVQETVTHTNEMKNAIDQINSETDNICCLFKNQVTNIKEELNNNINEINKELNITLNRISDVEVNIENVPTLTIPSVNQTRNETSKIDSPLISIQEAQKKGSYFTYWKYPAHSIRAKWWIKQLRKAGYTVIYGIMYENNGWHFMENEENSEYYYRYDFHCKALKISWA